MPLLGDSPSGSRVRATQTIVSHMGFCWEHPSLVLIEIAWRWLFGIPLLCILWAQGQKILGQIPPASVGLDRVDLQNPWLSAVLIAEATTRYQHPVFLVLRWLIPAGIMVWAVVSGIGRTLALKRMQLLNRHASGPIRSASLFPGVIGLQGLWAVALVSCVWLWYRAVGWASAAHITAGDQPDLVGYLCWLIFLTLGVFTLWALLSWTITMAPILKVLRCASKGSSFRALRDSFHLGKGLSSKLLEVNLVLAIVKIILIVLDMVFSAAPLPFADQFGPDALHILYVAIFIGFLIANDFFHVVRLRAFSELWRFYKQTG